MAKKKHSHKEKFERGGAMWGLNSLRSDGLSRLLDDLVDAETKGLAAAECNHVKTALAKIATQAAAVPDGSFWRRTILSEFERFADAYTEWNAKEGPSGEATHHRRQALRVLRQRRNDIATRIRLNQHILVNELDLMLVEGMYSALKDLTMAVPAVFRSVGAAVIRFETRRSNGD